MKHLFLLATLAACVSTPIKPTVDKRSEIFKIVEASKCTTYRWKDRGVAPIGYMKGIALVYAKNYCSPLKTVNTGKYGALDWYGKARNQRNLFTLMIGLGLRESSGKYCCGRDWSNGNSGTAQGAEAGTFQTSYNAAYSVQVNGNPAAANEMRSLLEKYKTDPSPCYLDVFKEGVPTAYCTGGNARNFGDGVGLEYQKLAKACPTFHAEFTALTLQNSYKHYGPIIKKAAEYRPECEQMLIDIEKVGCQ